MRLVPEGKADFRISSRFQPLIGPFIAATGVNP